MITFGTTKGAPWVEAVATAEHPFSGRTFSRLHVNSRDAPVVAEIWATSDHVVVPHAHGTDELLYVLSGAIEIDGRRLEANEVVFIRAGTAYSARVLTPEGSHVLRVAFAGDREAGEYEARVWRGAVTEDGFPDLSS
jgi:redox-sensitive bicupin YhaK (pirin superfamily)